MANVVVKELEMGEPRWSQLEKSPSFEPLFTVLQDEGCRQLLEALNADHLTAKELAECCDIPLSTVYRKLTVLNEANIVEESTHVDLNGSNASAYCLTIEAFTISVGMQEGLTIEVSTTD